MSGTVDALFVKSFRCGRDKNCFYLDELCLQTLGAASHLNF